MGSLAGASIGGTDNTVYRLTALLTAHRGCDSKKIPSPGVGLINWAVVRFHEWYKNIVLDGVPLLGVETSGFG